MEEKRYCEQQLVYHLYTVIVLNGSEKMGMKIPKWFTRIFSIKRGPTKSSPRSNS